MLFSILEESQFAHDFLKVGPDKLSKFFAESYRISIREGDIENELEPDNVFWFIQHTGLGLGINNMPERPLVNYGLKPEVLTEQIVRYCLLGLGFKSAKIDEFISKQQIKA